MGLLSFLTTNPTAFVIIALALTLSLTAHEFAHAYTADRLGDPTPRRMGRVTLNPLAHLDPFGVILLLVAGFGFARPVPVNFNNLGRWGMVAVAAAGPISNILIALLCVVLLKVLPETNLGDTILGIVASINVVLAVFNLIPIPLLDGSRILAGIFPNTLGRSLMEFERLPYAFLIVMGFILLARGPLSNIIGTVQGWLFGLAGV
ncbi:site-2 protease family protein [Deinococcus psychrotolerans]|uniref:Site-2 protease family protein n=1 Tax=Deinococcus psychrotolerans TaxID=2489213 RepID=A0A3G8YEA4_9DEIO|nr:site-2 protease family protein [Deinococcus psychrotolerans]AZI43642.1 site-2 protease family protein [Deinococcus psychrotolerans]